MKQQTTDKELQKAIKQRNFYLLAAKANKGFTMALYYVGLIGAPVAGIVKACQADKFSDGMECVLAGGVMGAIIIGTAAVLRQTNIPLLRDYVNLRDQINNTTNQNSK